jgi:hypothetical protein
VNVDDWWNGRWRGALVVAGVVLAVRVCAGLLFTRPIEG